MSFVEQTDDELLEALEEVEVDGPKECIVCGAPAVNEARPPVALSEVAG